MPVETFTDKTNNSEIIAKTKAEGMDVQKSMDGLVAELNTSAATITPAKVEPKK